MGSVREGFELILVAVFTSVTADVIGRLRLRDFGRTDLRRFRGVVVAEQTDGRDNEATDQECFKESTHL
jgi:hypothetical protein